MSTLPHKCGGEKSEDNGGLYFEIIWKNWPMNNSGGQVEKAIVPPGFRTLNISESAFSGFGANICPNWLKTTSKKASS